MVKTICLVLLIGICVNNNVNAGTIDRVWCTVSALTASASASAPAPASASASAVIHFSSTQKIESYQKPEHTSGKIIVRFPNCTFAASALDTSCNQNGIALSGQQIRTFAVFTLSSIKYDGAVQIKRISPNQVDVVVSESDISPKASTPTTTASTSNKKWELDVIVIDPGHGGIDAGAQGVNGVYEKDVALAVSKRLRDLIREAMPSTKVVMTRETDTFIELYKRGEIANKAKGKLFICIHCNSMPTKPHPAHGCETYILRPGRNADATNVAARENASIEFEKSKDRYAGLDADKLIVATMAQRSFVRFSEELAHQVQSSVKANTPLANRGVNQAGFYVLVGASMPNIYIETAFLSNPDDAAYISSTKGQGEMAQAILKAIQIYVRTYEKAVGR